MWRFVVMDIAGFKVGHSAGVDIDATALRAARARSSSIGAMEEMSRGFKMQTLTSCDATFMSTRTAAGQFKGQSKGAMEEVLQKVQHASTHILRPQNHEHAHSSRSIQGSVQGGDGGNVWEGSKCKHSPTVTPHS